MAKIQKVKYEEYRNKQDHKENMMKSLQDKKKEIEYKRRELRDNIIIK